MYVCMYVCMDNLKSAHSFIVPWVFNFTVARFKIGSWEPSRIDSLDPPSRAISLVLGHTRWFKYDRDKLWLVYTQIVPVIFEPPCSTHVIWHRSHNRKLYPACVHQSKAYIFLRDIWNETKTMLSTTEVFFASFFNQKATLSWGRSWTKGGWRLSWTSRSTSCAHHWRLTLLDKCSATMSISHKELRRMWG
jgi:hypothetical protein